MDDEYILQNKNDKLCIFLGARLENGDRIWRFDEVGTPKYVMKCPPFDIIVRSLEKGDLLNNRVMIFHRDWNWFMKAMYLVYKKGVPKQLENDFDFIKREIVNFDYFMFSDPLTTFNLLIDYVDKFNSLKIK